MRRTCSGMSKWVPCSSADRPVGQRLHPVPERLLALDACGPGRRRARPPPRRRVAPGDDLVGDGAHLGLEPGQLLEAPGVRLVQVDRGAEEVPRGELVALPARRPASPGRAGPAPRAGTGRTRRSPRSPPRRPARRSARERAAPASSRSTSPGKKSSPSGSTQMSHCLATSSICACALTWPCAAASQQGASCSCSSAAATAASRAAMLAPPPRPRSASGRRPIGRSCSALVMTLTSLVDLAGVVPLQGQAEPLLHGLLGDPLRSSSGSITSSSARVRRSRSASAA